MINLDEIEARANDATPGPWRHEGQRVRGVCEIAFCGLTAATDGPTGTLDYTRNARFIAHARTDVPALVARVRELEAERNSYARSHAILKAIHGALTDALPNTPIPALDSFDVVEMVRGLAEDMKK